MLVVAACCCGEATPLPHRTVYHGLCLIQEVDGILAESDCVVFVSSSCPYCAQAIAALESAGVEHTVVERTSEMAAVLQSKTGKTSVPSCWVKGQYVGGCNDGPESWMGVVPMLRSGKLKELLATE